MTEFRINPTSPIDSHLPKRQPDEEGKKEKKQNPPKEPVDTVEISDEARKKIEEEGNNLK